MKGVNRMKWQGWVILSAVVLSIAAALAWLVIGSILEVLH